MSRATGLAVLPLLFGCAAGSPAQPVEAAPTPSARQPTQSERSEVTTPAPTVTGHAVSDVVTQLPFDVPLERRKPLGESRVAWAHYLNSVHNRVHPIFADEFLAGLKQLPPSDPLNGEVYTALQIVLDPRDGAIDTITVVRTSGVQAFDAGAVEAIRRAAPFGTTPDNLRSEDGKVHFQWVLHRNERFACSTYYMMPLRMKSPIAN